jgi:hypothetical protein
MTRNQNLLCLDLTLILEKLNKINIRVKQPVGNVRNFGFYMSSYLSVTKHVNKILSAGYYTLKQMNNVKHRLDTDIKKILTHV